MGVDFEFFGAKNTNYWIISLIQISTNQSDYIFDAMTLRDKIRTDNSPFSLKSLFRVISITKIFHAFDHDLKYIISDLEIVTINVFDTSKAFLFIQKLPGDAKSQNPKNNINI